MRGQVDTLTWCFDQPPARPGPFEGCALNVRDRAPLSHPAALCLRLITDVVKGLSADRGVVEIWNLPERMAVCFVPFCP